MPVTIGNVIGVYEQGKKDVKEAYEQLLKTADSFDSIMDYPPLSRDLLKSERDSILEKMNTKAWQKIIDISGARKFMSSKKLDELDKRIHRDNHRYETIEPMPELNAQKASDMIQALIQNGRDFAEDMLREAFDYCRPARSEFKTNKKFRVGKKVIWYGVEMSFGKFRLYYGTHADKFRVLDRAFHLLDGKGMSEKYNGSYNSPLIDAIQSSKNGSGETEYFDFKCYKKGTVHITFKRPDLVEMLNQVGNGGKFEVGSGE